MNPYTAEDFAATQERYENSEMEIHDPLVVVAALRIAARYASAGLLTDPPTAWIAPMEADALMVVAAYEPLSDLGEPTQQEIERVWSCMRDAYLKEQFDK